ncbi:MAG: hypothetical protein SV377_03030 [Halobacteria archaeon]|nr:hypothetical protein [Halobacteria archaeon]
MTEVTLTLDKEEAQLLKETIGEDYQDKSEAVKELIERVKKIEELEEECQDLRRELKAANRRTNSLKNALYHKKSQRKTG